MNSQKILKIFAFYLLIVFFTGCAGTPIKFGGTHPNFDNTNVDFTKGKEIVSTASGFQLLLFIPININSRHEQALQQLMGMAGRDYITDIKIEESWVYAFVGTVYTTTIKAMSYPRKVVDSSDIQQTTSQSRVLNTDGRFIAYSDGTVLDTKTNLMWAAKDNGVDINWQNAKNYCENYRVGGYTDWRMPMQSELTGLYNKNKPRPMACDTSYNNRVETVLIDISCYYMWASETDSSFFRSTAACASFFDGEQAFFRQSYDGYMRVLPVRSIK